MEEIWKEINGYKISNYGTIIGKKGNPLTNKPDMHGYLGCSIDLGEPYGKVGGQHRVIAFAFLYDDYKKGYEVNHIDADKSNNRVDNLEWGTHQHNMTHVSENRLHKRVMYVCEVSDDKIIKIFDTIKVASDEIGCSPGDISKCCRGIINSIYGLKIRKYNKDTNTYCKTEFDTTNKMTKGKYNKVIRCIETNDIAMSQQEMANILNIRQPELSKALRGLISNCNGYTFEYLEK